MTDVPAEVTDPMAGKGAYVLLIETMEPLDLDIAGLDPAVLAPGRYAYCGSAYGPGGLNARIARHLRTEKAVHWHIDRVTIAGRILDVYGRLGAKECALVEQLLRLPGAAVPVPGFGSSDCRRCRSHLVALAPSSVLATMGDVLIG